MKKGTKLSEEHKQKISDANKNMSEETKQKISASRQGIPYRRKCRNTCDILKSHARDLKDDSERLSTEFLQKMIGVKCK